jgi:hypothetical protein
MTCPQCQEPARFVGYRPKKIISLVGAMDLSRPYYHCVCCQTGILPWDEMLRLSPERLTPGAQEVTTLLGITNSFGNAADRVLHKSAGLRLCESTVERTTEAAGERLGKRLEQGEVFGAQRPWQWNLDARGKTCAYVSVDWTGIMMQGPAGAKADGRMVAVGMVYDPQPRAEKDDDTVSMPCDGVRYLSGLYTLEELGLQMRRQAAQVGMDAAEQWISLTDAGSGVEHFMDVNFPLAVQIVDFRHAGEYAHDFAKLYAVGEAEKLAAAWCHTLKHEGGAALLAIFKGLDRAKMTPSVCAGHDTVLTYFGNHHKKMDYPTYLRNGWQIGSGAVESACKTVVNRRLNMGGMRWGEEGADAVAHLRALHCSDADQWDAFWYGAMPA